MGSPPTAPALHHEVGALHCRYHAAGVCRSCTQLDQTYPEQLRRKDRRVRTLMASAGLQPRWQPPFGSPPTAFRAKAKMVVGGTPAEPTLGILDPSGRGVDLRECLLLGPATAAALPELARFIGETGLRPYDVPSRSGELKYLHVLESAAGELMVRFVMRSEGQVGRLRRRLPVLHDALPGLRVVSANLLPEHRAVVEGELEIPLSEQRTLPMQVGDVTLHVFPGAFVQTNSAVAGGLYRQAAAWLPAGPALDLYCGVGGFALHAARDRRPVSGVEVSAQAVASATRSAREAGLDARFQVGDATSVARDLREPPEAVIVNPPRRGIGPGLAEWLSASGVGTVVYSSCNPTSLVRDLAELRGLTPVRARMFDMFPQSDHAEVLVLLQR